MGTLQRPKNGPGDVANPDPNLSPDMIELTLPYPPSVNHLYRHVGNRVLISREGRKFRDQVGLFIAFAGHPRFECPVKIDVELYPPDRRTRDIDNARTTIVKM